MNTTTGNCAAWLRIFRLVALTLPTLICFASTHAAADCTNQSGNPQLHLIELYSSEGCSSCPPAEQWMTSLLKHPEIAGLEFHVDYWDSTSWKDPFASHSYTERQEAMAKRSNHGQIYSPQIWADGHIWRNWPKGTPPALVDKPSSTLSATVVMGASLRATFDVSDPDSKDKDAYHLYAAVTENDLTRSVAGGENKGKKLSHDDVVRAFSGPQQLPHAEIEFKLPPDVVLSHASVVGFIQDEHDGSVTQVVRVPLDKCQKP